MGKMFLYFLQCSIFSAYFEEKTLVLIVELKNRIGLIVSIVKKEGSQGDISGDWIASLPFQHHHDKNNANNSL